MSKATSSPGFAVSIAIGLVLAACGSELESPAERSQAVAGPSSAGASSSPSADARVDPTPAAVAGDADEILLRMDITPDHISPNPQGLGGAGWYAPGADFTLYGDGTIIFRDFAEDAGHPQNDGSHLIGHPLQTGHLTAEQVTEVLRFALGEGGLADARRRYSINVVDLYTLPEFELRSGDIEKRVTLHGGGVVAPDASIDQFATLSEYLSNVDDHLDVAVDPWSPDRYWGLLRQAFPHEISDVDPLPWPWADIQPAGWLGGRRSLLPDDVAALGLADISGGVCCVQLSGPDGAGPYSLEIAPAIPTPLRPDAMAEVVTNDLVVRSRPGTGPESEIYSPNVSAPMILYVAEGPVEADGHDWYLVAPVTAEPSPEPPLPSGWMAAAARDGEPWIASTSLILATSRTCPFPTLEGISDIRSRLARLACYGDEELTLEGTFGGCGYDDVVASSAHWLVKAGCILLPLGYDPDVVPGTGYLAIRLPFQTWPDAQPDARLRVEGHFDDPAAETCVDEPTPPDLEDLPEIVVLRCRGEFVATQVTIISD